MKTEVAIEQLIAQIDRIASQLDPLVPKQETLLVPEEGSEDKAHDKGKLELEKSIWRDVIKMCGDIEHSSRSSVSNSTKERTGILAKWLVSKYYGKFNDERLKENKRLAEEDTSKQPPHRGAGFLEASERYGTSDENRELIDTISGRIQGLESRVISLAEQIPNPRAAGRGR